MITISVNLSRTLNLGNYESMKLELGVEEDVTEEEYEDAHENALAELKEKMDNMLPKLEKEYSNVR